MGAPPEKTGPPSRIVVSGAGGLIGSALSASLGEDGCRVDRLVRDPKASAADTIYWNWRREEIDAARLEGADAVVHLAGRNIASSRWTEAERSRLAESRIGGTRFMARTLAGLERPPGLFLAASAIGYYGDRGDAELDESSPPGEGFLAGLCRDWEAACEPAERAGLRVVKLRIGVVLSRAGGALPRMLSPFLMGLGGKLGDGRQYMSWISRHDLVRVIRFVVGDPSVGGAVNAVAPGSLTNAEFTRTLARVLRRPAPFTVPAAAIRVFWGAMGRETLLASARVLPRRLEEAGFEFRHAGIEQALRFELDRPA